MSLDLGIVRRALLGRELFIWGVNGYEQVEEVVRTVDFFNLEEGEYFCINFSNGGLCEYWIPASFMFKLLRRGKACRVDPWSVYIYCIYERVS